MDTSGVSSIESLLSPGEQLFLEKPTKLRGEAEGGLLLVTSSRLVWVKAGKARLSIPFNEIKSQLASKQQSSKVPLLKVGRDENPQAPGYMFEFLASTPDRAWKDRDAAKELVTACLKKAAAAPSPPPLLKIKQEPGTEPLQSQPGRSSVQSMGRSSSSIVHGKVSQAEVEQRLKLLSSNKELRNLHEQLVKSGAVTDEEFWESRKSMIQNELSKVAAQQTGMPSALLSDVRPEKETNLTVHYNLTPTIIHQIFVEKPAVEKLYKENVPHKMAEQEFWTKYFESLYFYRDQQKSTISSQPDERFAKAATEEVTETEPIVVKRKLRDIDMSVDVSANGGDLYTAAKEYESLGEKQPSYIQNNKSLGTIRRLNRHSALVLGSTYDGSGPIAKKQKKTSPGDAVTFGDLEERRPEPVTPLNIENQRVYFEARARLEEAGQSEETLQQVHEDQLKAFQGELRRWKMDSQKVRIPQELASKILLEVMQQKIPNGDREASSGEGMDLENLPADFRQRLYHFSSTTCELLRHFWASYPVNAPPQKKKAERILNSMSPLYDEIRNYSQSLPKDQRQCHQLLLPILRTLDIAFEKHAKMVVA